MCWSLVAPNPVHLTRSQVSAAALGLLYCRAGRPVHTLTPVHTANVSSHNVGRNMTMRAY